MTRTYTGLVAGGSRIFYFGGGHSSHPGNDVDLYHIGSNQWEVQNVPECPANGSPEAIGICGSGGTVSKLTPMGRPYTQHAYRQCTYDSTRKRFLCVLPSGTWSFDTADRAWTCLAGPSKGTFSPDWSLSHGGAVYDAAADRLVAFVTNPSGATSGRGVYAFNPSSNSWSFQTLFPSPTGFADLGVFPAYNTDKQEIAVVFGSWMLYRYHLPSNTWNRVSSFPSALAGLPPNFDYDTRSKRMVFLRPPYADSSVTRPAKIWAWDVDSNLWANLPTPSTAPKPVLYNSGNEMGSFVYDPVLNVFTYLEAISLYCGGFSSSWSCGGLTKTWLYRYSDADAPAPLPSFSFSISAASTPYGDSALLSWASSNADSCAASGGWSGVKPPAGSESTGVLTSSKTFSLTCSGPGGTTPPKSVSIKISTPSVSFLPASLNFGSQIIGASVPPQLLTLMNGGTADLKLLGISFSGAEFSQTNDCPAILPPGSHCSFTVRFLPVSTGPKTGHITISDDAAGSPHKAPLSGTGIEAAALPVPDIPITLSEPDGIFRSSDPVTSGIPLPPGASASGWSLFDGSVEMPLQTSQLPGRIPWLLLDFQADLPPLGKKTLTLRQQASTLAAPKPVTIIEDSGGIEVLTGAMKARIGKSPFVPLESVWLDNDGDGTFTDSELLFSSPADSLRILDAASGQSFSAAGSPDRMFWEYQGPLRSTLRVDGRHRNDSGEFIAYTARLSFFAGLERVKIEHIVRNSHQPNERHVKIKSATLRLGAGAAIARAARSGSALWSNAGPGGALLEIVPASSDSNGGMVLPDLSHYGASWTVDFADGLSATEAARRKTAAQSPLFALAEPAWYSEHGQMGSSRFSTLEDEKEANNRWGWAWNVSQLPSFPHNPGYYVGGSQVDVHADTEADNVWQDTLMYVRTGSRGYLDRAMAWARFHKWEMAYRTDTFSYAWDSDWEGKANAYPRPGISIPLTAADSSFLGSAADAKVDVRAWGGDHLWGWGLINYYYLTGDTDALEAARDIAEISERVYSWRAPGSDVTLYGPRQAGRNLLLAARVWEATGDPRWRKLLDHIVDLVLKSPSWDARGAFDSINGVLPHQTAALNHALYRVWELTGNPQVRDRLIKMAEFARDYALHPLWYYSARELHLDTPKAGEILYSDFANGELSSINPYHTFAWVDALVRGYRLTGDLGFLERAKFHWTRSSKTKYGQSVTAQPFATDDQAGKFMNNGFAYPDIYYDLNGDLQFAHLLFHEYARADIPKTITPSMGLAASPAAVPFNSTATLSWSAANAISCDASGAWSGAKPVASGSEAAGPLLSTKLYVLTCRGAVGIATRMSKLSVGAAPPAISTSSGLLLWHSYDASDMDWSAATDLADSDRAIDTGGKGRNGYVRGPVSAAGRRLEALGFDEANDYVLVPDFSYGPKFTLSFWFNAPDNAGSDRQTLYSHGLAGYAPSLTVYLSENSSPSGPGQLVTQLLDNAGGSVFLAAPAGLADGQWHLYTLTTDAGLSNLYIDGALKASSPKGIGAFDPGGGVHVGADSQLRAGKFFGGSMDDFRLYAGPLGAEEVWTLFDSTGPAPKPLLSLFASSSTVGPLGTATMTWTSLHTSSCAASGGWSGARPVSGKEAVGPLGSDTTFTLTCFGVDASSVSRSATVFVDGAAPTISAVTASKVFSSSAVISWTTDEPSDSRVEYGTSTSYGVMSPLDTPLVLSHFALLAGLLPDTTHRYRVLSRDAQDNLAVSGDFSFATLPPPSSSPSTDAAPPSTPAGLAALALSSTQISLAWNPSTDDTAVSGYKVFRCQGAGCSPAVQIATRTKAGLSDAGLTPDTAYVYRVSAFDAAGNVSALSASASTKTLRAPPPPGGLLAAALVPAFGGSVGDLVSLGIRITVHAGALSKPATFYVYSEDTSDAVREAAKHSDERNRGMSRASPAFHIQAPGALSSEPVERFSIPLTLSMAYDPLKAPKPSALGLFYWDESRRRWQAVAGGSLDSIDYTLSLEVDHLGIFAIYQTASVPADSSGSLEFGDVFAYPNPARGAEIILHAEIGPVDSLDIRIFDLAGTTLHRARLSGLPSVGINGKQAYEYDWNLSGIAAGTYFYSAKAGKAGRSTQAIRKFAVVR